VVEQSYPFTQQAKDKLKQGIHDLVNLYTKCVTRGDEKLAKEQLKLNQRENIAWERDTVWRQMIGRERRGEGAEVEGATLVKPEEPPFLVWETPLGPFKVTKRKLRLVLAIMVFLVMINIKIVEGVEANNCIAILALCTILWATEVCSLDPSPFDTPS